MGKYKRGLVALWGGILLFASNAYAQFPVFDVPEIAPVIKDVKENIKNVQDLQKQLMTGYETLNSIGKSVNSIIAFDKESSETDESDVYSASESVQKNSKDEEKTVKEISEKTPDEITETVTTQQEITDDYINQVEQILGFQEHFADSLPKNVNIKNNVTLKEDIVVLPIADSSIIVEEEEEEEEEIEVSEVQEEILALQKTILNEQKQLATSLMDVLENQLTKINTSANNNIAALNKLNSAIQNMEKISEEDKKEFGKKITEISQKQRKASDWTVQIVENAKENYNKEYNNTIKNGINNYTKIVLAYTKGDADKEDVINAGKKLKADMRKINVTPDKGVLKELEQTVADVRVDIEKLGKEVDDVLQNVQKLS